MDEETVNLILDIQIEDLKSITSGRKEKAAEGSAPTDQELAVELQQNEIQNRRLLLTDYRMARSFGRAVQDDGIAVVNLAAEEHQSTQDHNTALQLGGGPSPVVSEVPSSTVDEDSLSRFTGFNTYSEDHARSFYSESLSSFTELEAGDSSSWAATCPVRSPAQHECIACDELRETLETPCHHHYCQNCLTKLATDALVDESLFPLRCCGQAMPTSSLRPHIGDGLTKQIEEKAIELDTPDRTYCVACGLFVNPDHVEGIKGHCIVCDANTCTLCKRAFHIGGCPKDTALEAVLSLAQETGWQRCLGCKALVERREGCNHIT